MNTAIRVTHEWTFTARPEPGVSLDDLEKRLIAIGNRIIRRDHDGIVIGYSKESQVFSGSEPKQENQ